MRSNRLQVGSLFSGVGLCDLGLSWAGMQHSFFCEVDPFCRSVLAKHWPDIPIYEDVKTLKGSELPPVDVLCGGFPCQDVSSGGLRAGIRQDTRSGLWLEYARLIGELRPKYAIIENVRGLLSLGINIVLGDLAALGYDAEWEIVPAAVFGAPHHRERVFIVAYTHSCNADPAPRLLSPLQGIVGNHEQPFGISAWLGIRFDRTRKASAWEAYRGPVIYRVDDGSAGGLDYPMNIPPVHRRIIPEWYNRLKALGNGILPQQAYAVGVCIMKYEGINISPMPVWQSRIPVSENRLNGEQGKENLPALFL